MSTCPPGSVGTYPDADWDRYFKDKYGKQKPDDPIIFHGVELKLPEPTDLVGAIDECAQLRQLKVERGARGTHIFREAQSAYAPVASVLAAIGLSTDDPVNPMLKLLVGALVSEIETPIYQFKAKFLRARPWTCCGADLNPMLMRPHWRYPGQPAYPSGHATVAWFFAYLLGEGVTPKEQVRLANAAARVAHNREVAGVHYASDSEAGRLLARQLVDVLIRKGAPGTAALLAAAGCA